MPVDFETDRLDDAPAFFSWLGVTCYLTREAIGATITQIASVVEQMDRFVERRGEPMRSAFSPEEFVALMGRAGFVETDHVSPDEQVRRYLQGRHDIPAPPPNFARWAIGLSGVPRGSWPCSWHPSACADN